LRASGHSGAPEKTSELLGPAAMFGYLINDQHKAPGNFSSRTS
jgi:hypothetical protein